MVVHKKQLIEKIVQIKAIDSSLFLPERDEEHISFTDRVIGIKTSDSIIDLKEYLKEERKSFTLKPGINPYK